ncbi:MAG: hypothetical protein R3335_07090 [Anaerolineales bacterium]|nr:hypothetical protein [Anaerolineales bacterium]
MVHALKEIWRVLKPAGTIIDLRPVQTSPQLEILTDAGAESAGRIDDYGHLVEDRAGDAAFQELVQQGLFKPGSATHFRFAFYWESVADMEAYTDDMWTTSKVPAEVMARARRLAGETYGPARVRVRRKLQLATYTKA